MYLPSHHFYACTRTINIQSTLHTAPDLCKNVSLIVFGSSSNSYTVSTQANMYTHKHTHTHTHTHTHSSNCRNAGQEKEITKTGTAINSMCQENISACTHATGLPALL